MGDPIIIAAALFGIGAAAGALGALLGLGGGIFLVPLLTLVFDLPIRVAVGTSLVGVIATSAGVAAFAPRGRGGDVGLALRLESVTTAGAIAGSLLTGVLSTSALHALFAAVVFFAAGTTLRKARRRGPDAGEHELLFRRDYRPTRWPAGLGGAGIAGMVSGLLGVGGGFIKVPVMYAVMDVPLGVATATSNFMVGVTAAASVFVYYGRGDIHPTVVVPTAAGVFLGAMGAVYLLPRVQAARLREALVALLVVLGAWMLFEGL